MSAKHTPGPLTILGPSKPTSDTPQGGDYAITDARGRIVAEAFARCSDAPDGLLPARENALLFAGAPDLLAYAKCEEARSRGEDIAETVLRQHGWTPSAGTSHEFMDSMRRAAIAKATGSAS